MEEREFADFGFEKSVKKRALGYGFAERSASSPYS
jgi:hypothetical protein